MVGGASERHRCHRCKDNASKRRQGVYGTFRARTHFPLCPGKLRSCLALNERASIQSDLGRGYNSSGLKGCVLSASNKNRLPSGQSESLVKSFEHARNGMVVRVARIPRIADLTLYFRLCSQLERHEDLLFFPNQLFQIPDAFFQYRCLRNRSRRTQSGCQRSDSTGLNLSI